MQKDKADLRKYQKDNVDRLGNLLKAAEMRTSAKVEQLAAVERQLASLKTKVSHFKSVSLLSEIRKNSILVKEYPNL